VSTITDGENAANVIGQSNFTNGTAGTSQSRLSNPRTIAYDATNNRLYVGEDGNDRVMMFAVSTITDGMNASNVLGQPDFTSTGAAVDQNSLTDPHGLAIDTTGNRLFVGDNGANRVLVFDVSTITDGENAANVLGQTNFTNSAAATTQSGLSGTQNVAYDSTNNRLFVVEIGNDRVLVFDVAAIADGENAVNVLGQTNFTSATTGTTQSAFTNPFGVDYDSTNKRIYVAEIGNNRVMVFDAAPPLTGTVYSDEGSTALTSVGVAISINGGSAAFTTTSNSSGVYTISTAISQADVLTLYIDGATQDGVTVTLASSAATGTGAGMTGINIGLTVSLGQGDVNDVPASLKILNKLLRRKRIHV
jgi:DNA-binding beta-propeller fold protein YncE